MPDPFVPPPAMPPPAVPAPVLPRAAATVIVLRDSPAGIETFLLRRHDRLAFAGGMTVFPGGAVDPADHAGTEDGADAALRRAAVRETAEEIGVVLDPAVLLPWCRWITPESEPRRFDATFYVAALPAAAVAVADTGEALDGAWIRPADALAQAGAGARSLLPPTAVALAELVDYADVAAVLAAAPGRDLSPVLPVLAGGHAVLADGRVVPMPAHR
jgi:8-oxo-dGTP pyrophosphatase MutT (NUDIX family)